MLNIACSVMAAITILTGLCSGCAPQAAESPATAPGAETTASTALGSDAATVTTQASSSERSTLPTTPPAPGAGETAPSIPEAFMIDMRPTNYIDYQPGMECAAFASAFLLRHYGEEADGMALFETFPSRAPDGGTMPSGIVALFEGRGYAAAFVQDGTVARVKAEIAKAAPVIVFIHVEEPYTTTHNTHYVPLVGYDREHFYFAESLAEYANCKDDGNPAYNRKTDFAKFARLWTDIDGFWDCPYYVITPGP